jgi:hypothetical protein
LYLIADEAIVVSFDRDWLPFIGFGHGYNDPDHRIYLPQNLYILDLCSKSLENLGMDIPGGRIFIRNNYVFHRSENAGRRDVIRTWNLKGRDIVNEISMELLEMRVRRLAAAVNN